MAPGAVGTPPPRGPRVLRRLRTHRLPVQRAVERRREIPTERPRHRAAPHRIEAVLGLEGFEGAAHAAEEGFRRWLREQEAGLAVRDGFGEAAGLVTDGERS